MADSSVPLWEKPATERVLTGTVREEVGPAVWKSLCEQTECKQAAPWEGKVSPGHPSSQVPFPLCPGSQAWTPLASLSLPCFLHPHPFGLWAKIKCGTAFPDPFPNLHICPRLFLIVWDPHSLSKVGLGVVTDPDLRAGLVTPTGLLRGEGHREDRGWATQLWGSENRLLLPRRYPQGCAMSAFSGLVSAKERQSSGWVRAAGKSGKGQFEGSANWRQGSFGLWGNTGARGRSQGEGLPRIRGCVGAPGMNPTQERDSG